MAVLSRATRLIERAGLVPLTIFAIVSAVFANTVGRYLVWSDFYQIQRSHMLVTGRHDLQKIWSPDQLRENNYFRPVQVLSSSLDWMIHGEKYEGFHLTQVVLHALAAVVVFLLAEQILVAYEVRSERVVAAVAAVAWAIAPQRTESVAWLADRGSLLQVITLLGLLAGMRIAAPGRAAVVATALVTVGILAKEIAVTAPLLFLLLAWVQGHRLDASTKRRARVVFLALLSAATAYLVIRRTLFWSTLSFDVHYDLLTRMRTQVVVTADYLADVLFPFHPSAADVVAVRNRFDARVLADLGLLLALLGAAVHRARKGDRLPLFALLWFFVALAPAANIGVQRHFRGDRYVYLAAFGPVLLVTLRLAAITTALGVRFKEALLAPGAAALLLAAMAWSTLARNKEWASNDKTNEAFFRSELAREPHFREALGNLCLAASKRGDFWKAREYCARGLAIDERQWTSTAWQPKAFWAALFDLEWAQHDKNDCARLLERTTYARANWPNDENVEQRIRSVGQRCGSSNATP